MIDDPVEHLPRNPEQFMRVGWRKRRADDDGGERAHGLQYPILASDSLRGFGEISQASIGEFQLLRGQILRRFPRSISRCA